MSKNNFSADFNEQLRKSISEKSLQELKWTLISNFLAGNQHFEIERNTQTLQNVDPAFSSRKKPKITANLLSPLFRHVVSKLAIEYPSISVLPASDSSEDIVKAQVSEQALKYYWDQDSIGRKLTDVIKWIVMEGNCGLHTYYDPISSKVITEIVSPYDIFFEPYVTSPEESEWCAVRKLVTPESLKQLFPDQAELIDEAADSSSPRGSQKRPYDRDKIKNRIDVWIVYDKSDQAYGFFIDKQNHWLWQGEYPEGITPVQLVKYSDIPGQLWGVGLLEPLIDLQFAINKELNYMHDNAEMMGNPQWLVPNTCDVPAGAFTNKPGKVIKYNAVGGEPHQVGAAEVPAYRLQHQQELKSLINDISSVHSTSMGKKASGILGATAIQSLAQNDASQLQLTQDNIEHMVTQLAKTALVLMKQYYVEKQFIRMLDDTGTTVFRELQATDIVDTPEIKVEAGSLFKDNTQSRYQKTIDLLTLGLIDKEEALLELSFKTSNKFLNDKIKSISRAKKFLEIAKTGEFDIRLTVKDDLDAFERVFGEFINSDDFYQLVPEVQDHIENIYNNILLMLQQKQSVAGVPKDLLDKLKGQPASPRAATQTPVQATGPAAQQAPSPEEALPQEGGEV